MSVLVTKRAVTVPYRDGRHVAHSAGHPVSLEKTAEFFQNKWKDGDSRLRELFAEQEFVSVAVEKPVEAVESRPPKRRGRPPGAKNRKKK